VRGFRDMHRNSGAVYSVGARGSLTRILGSTISRKIRKGGFLLSWVSCSQGRPQAKVLSRINPCQLKSRPRTPEAAGKKRGGRKKGLN